ncbi:MAG: alpha-ribazole phosphatase [Nitrospirae bacterium]|nr:MAG: alpha-ribazole phosphatase [Nitrospirota bacterium]
MNSTTLLLVRHGKTVGSEELRYKGHIDVPLSEEGIKEVEALARIIKGHFNPVSKIYCSDLSRAKQTAEIIAGSLGLEPLAMNVLRERSFGLWEGMSFEEIASAYPEEFERWKSDPYRFSPPEGESTEDVKNRVVPAVEEIINRHRGERVMVVSHGGVTRVLLCHYLGIPLNNIFRIEQDFACLNVLEFFDDGFTLIRLINGRSWQVNG